MSGSESPSSELGIPSEDGIPEFYARSFSSSSSSSTAMDERINEFLDSEEPEGYLDCLMHHFQGCFFLFLRSQS